MFAVITSVVLHACMASYSTQWLLLSVCMTVLYCVVYTSGEDANNLTAGFVEVKLTEANFEVQKPYNVPLEERYRYSDGVRQFWVYPTDKPFNTQTQTNPRTEIRISGHDYSSGVWQFEGYGYVPSGTSGASIMQIHNAAGAVHATTLMLHVYNGTLRYYSAQAVEDNIYDRWFRLNVIHDVDASNITVYIDGVQKLAFVGGQGGAPYYFKFGVYVQHHDLSDCMESRWTTATISTKS